MCCNLQIADGDFQSLASIVDYFNGRCPASLSLMSTNNTAELIDIDVRRSKEKCRSPIDPTLTKRQRTMESGEQELDGDESQYSSSPMNVESTPGNEATGGNADSTTSAPFALLSNITTRPGSQLGNEDFEPSEGLYQFVRKMKVLVIGAGGLGCELLKNLAFSGFGDIHVIDMDTIDLSNLNRQFLFRDEDIGQPKADVAARAINRLQLEGCLVTPYNRRIEAFDSEFYAQFQFIISGLDSIGARRWLNSMLVSLLKYDVQTGELDQSTVIPLIDGGTEGFRGSVRVILPGMNACFECGMELFPPKTTYPLCTIAHTPRLPEHCIEYARVLLWPKEFKCAIDADDPDHLEWIYQRASERGREFGIEGIDMRLTKGVVKSIIPAVASTNAVIAGACAVEAFKMATFAYKMLDNSLVFNQSNGVYSFAYSMERNADCLVCSREERRIEMPTTAKLQEVAEYLRDGAQYRLSDPGFVAIERNGAQRDLYLRGIDATHVNYKRSLGELGLFHGQQLLIVDSMSAVPRRFRLALREPESRAGSSGPVA